MTTVQFFIAALCVTSAMAQTQADYSVTWNSPGESYRDSMPAGNGDIGINAWTEQNGDLVLLIAKSDAWSENGQLLKPGRIRIHLTPSPFVAGPEFRQILKPLDGVIEMHGAGGALLRVWVDANAPVIHADYSGHQAVNARVTSEIWRAEKRVVNFAAEEVARGMREIHGNPEGAVTIDPDTVLSADAATISWLHRNTRSVYPSLFEHQGLAAIEARFADPILNRTTGVAVRGTGLVSDGNLALKSSRAQAEIHIAAYVLTTQRARIADWQSEMQRLIVRAEAVNPAKALADHRAWWSRFWARSWIVVTGDTEAEKVTQGYAMQRWMMGAGGRGAIPQKFNGGMFSVAQEPAAGTPYDPAKGIHPPDYRAWGSNYWFQNQRLLYWPLIAAGDTDGLATWFRMFRDDLPLEKSRTETYFHHAGATFPETMFFFGLPNNNDYGWKQTGPVMDSRWIRYHINGGLELIQMMLDAWDVSGRDPAFARDTLIPVAAAVTEYFDVHWPRVNGKIGFEPSAALETRQTASNPAPDIAGLMAVLPRLLVLPPGLATTAQRETWSRILRDLPPLPRGHTDATGLQPQLPQDASPNGRGILWDAETFAKTQNVENPALCAVFPYRLFGVGKPELELARATWDARLFKASTCWVQDGIQAAMLGWADRAKKEVTANFTDYGTERFPWFWKPGHDWEPDLDNGGAGQMILQSMLLQTDGNKILLFPAWPKEWNVDFRLHAPRNTVVEAVLSGGKVTKLKVTPSLRAKDIVTLMPQ
jgi:hypothetical protein